MKTGPVRYAQQKKQCVYNIPCDCGRCHSGEKKADLEKYALRSLVFMSGLLRVCLVSKLVLMLQRFDIRSNFFETPFIYRLYTEPKGFLFIRMTAALGTNNRVGTSHSAKQTTPTSSKNMRYLYATVCSLDVGTPQKHYPARAHS
jgi:hypothetical protein